MSHATPKVAAMEPSMVTHIKRTQMYQLGRHRIACGDCRDEELVKRLYHGHERSPLIVTDPPYASGGYQESKRVQGTWKNIRNDALSTRGYSLLIERVFSEAAADGIYCFCDWRMHQTTIDAIEASNVLPRNCLTWCKVSVGLGPLWRTMSERIIYASNQSARQIKGLPAAGDVISIPRVRCLHHPTEKPIDLMKHLLAIDARTDRGACSVYDPFLGAGATLLAAEELGRTCFGVEMEPQYLQHTIERWESCTGLKAVEITDV